MRESSTTQQMWLAVMIMMMMVDVAANYVHCTLYNLANSWEEKALKVRLEMLSMADGEVKTNLQKSCLLWPHCPLNLNINLYSTEGPGYIFG